MCQPFWKIPTCQPDVSLIRNLVPHPSWGLFRRCRSDSAHFCRLLGDAVSPSPIATFRIYSRDPPFRSSPLYVLKWIVSFGFQNHVTGRVAFQSDDEVRHVVVHLPYCDKFVTAEKYGGQEKCLREVAFVADLETEILSYDHFCDSFLVTI